MVYGCYLHLLTFSGRQVTGRINWDPFPPFQPSWAEPPSLSPGVCTPPPANRPRRGQPQRNRTSASISRSEAADWARGWCGDHFGLFGASVRGRAAELEACAGWPARALKGHGNEADFLGFLHKSVLHGSLTLHFEPFRFWLRIPRDIRNRKTTPRLAESGSRQECI
jgi:hypothetical protein